MKAKTISQVINTKVEKWLASIEDRRLADDLRGKFLISGGCIASMLLKEKVNDYDLYFYYRDIAVRVATYYIDKFNNSSSVTQQVNLRDVVDGEPIKIMVKSRGVAKDTRFESEVDSTVETLTNAGDEVETVDTERKVECAGAFIPIFVSSNAIMLSGGLQLIFRFTGKPEEIIENYDYVHCTNYWSQSSGVVLNQPAIESLLTGELRYVGSKFPLCSLFRIRKFVQRGWSINAGQILKAVIQLQSIDLTKPSVLEDQLIGVDSAYFRQVIESVMEKDPDRVDTTYLIDLINRMF